MTRESSVEEKRGNLRRSTELTEGMGVQVLRIGLSDEDWRVRQEAIVAVAAHGPTPAVLALLVELIADSPNVGARNAAIEASGAFGSAAVASLATLLASRNGGERKFLIEALGHTGAAEARSVVAPFADDPDANVAAAALEALLELGGAEARAVFRKRLQMPSVFDRVAAFHGLARLGEELSWAELLPHLEDPVVASAALPLMGSSATIDALPLLCHTLGAGGRPAKTALSAVISIALRVGVGNFHRHISMVDESCPTHGLPIAAVRQFLSDEDPSVRRDAASLIFLTRERGLVTEALDAVGSDVLGLVAEQALRNWREGSVAPLLKSGDDCSTAAGRAMAMTLVAEIGSHCTLTQAARGALRDCFRRHLDDDEIALRAAARGLALFGDDTDIEVLLSIVVKRERNLARSACDALIAIGHRYPEHLGRLLGESQTALSPEYVRLYAATLRDESLPFLQAAVSSESSFVRRAAVEAMAGVAGPRAAQDIVFALADEDEDVVLTAIMVLGRIGRESQVALDALCQTLHSPVESHRSAAVRSIAACGRPELAARIRPLLLDAQSVASSAVEAWVALHGRESVEGIDIALHHADPEVVRTATSLLGVLPEDQALSRLVFASTHSSTKVRTAAVSRISNMASPQALVVLRNWLPNEREEAIRGAILTRLRRGSD